jgi:hypothetical protein
MSGRSGVPRFEETGRKTPSAAKTATDAAKKPSGEGVNYPSYLALDELLSLQRPRSQPEHPDELLFIIIHQAASCGSS